MSTFRPPQVPQQPRVFYTPGQAPGAVPAFSPWAQWAAYQRDRVEIAHLVQRMQPLTAGVAPDVLHPVGPWDQRPAHQRDRLELAHLIVLRPPFFTAGAAAGVPPPRSMDQSAAYQRYPAPPLQITVSFVAAPIQFVPCAPLVLPLRVRGDDLAILDEMLPPFSTPTVAPGVPPARTQDQSAAYQRTPAAPLQIAVFVPSPPSVPYITPAPLAIPIVARRDETPALEEALPGGFVAIAPPQYVAPVPFAFPMAVRRDETAALEEVLPPFAPSMLVSVPPPILQPDAVYRRDPMLPQQPRPGVIAPALALAPFVPMMRLQSPQLPPDQWPIWQFPLRSWGVPSIAPLAFYRGEVIALPDDDSHFQLRADSWRMTTLPDNQTRFELQIDNWRITVSFNDYRFMLKPRKPS